jgi:hypothetical protein
MNLDPIVRNSHGGLLAQGDKASTIDAAHRFDVIVFCAQEYQPHPGHILQINPRCRVLLAPNDDSELSHAQLQTATEAAQDVAMAFAQGRRVLITCMQGRNRSGLVTALALCMIYGVSGRRAARLVKERRTGAPALTNPHFVERLARIPACHAVARKRVPRPTVSSEIARPAIG